ncbi:MAG: hypothetical protein IKX22_05045 [Prevotella sp.]|nr:hypothetical protein [Prevotella sp.]
MTFRKKRYTHQYLVLTLAVLATLLFSCTSVKRHGFQGVLAVADSITNATQYNDSVIKLLEQVGDSMLRQGEATQMAYKLLCIKAYDKARQPYAGEDEIFDILEYYEKKGDKSLLPVALYYAGRHTAKQYDTPSALKFFHHAHELIANDSANTLNGWICSQTGYLFSQQMLYEESRSFFSDALRYVTFSKDTMQMIYSIRDIGGSYQMVGDPITCDIYLHKALRLAKEKRDTLMIRNVLCSLTDNNIEMGRYDSAKVYLKPLLTNLRKHEESAIYTNASKIYLHEGKLDSALYYIEKVLDVGTVQGKKAAYRNRTRIDLMRGDVAAAKSDFENYVLYIDSINHITASEALAKASAAYDYSMKEQENARLQENSRRWQFWTWISLASCIALVLALFLIYAYFRKRSAEESARSLALEIALGETRENTTGASLESLPEGGAVLTDKEKNPRQSKESGRYYEVRAIFDKHIDEQTNVSDDEWKTLEQYIGETYPQLVAELKKRVKMNEAEKQVCWLMKMRFTPSRIAILLNKTPQTITSIRARLYSKIFNTKGTSKQFDDFFESI